MQLAGEREPAEAHVLNGVAEEESVRRDAVDPDVAVPGALPRAAAGALVRDAVDDGRGQDLLLELGDREAVHAVGAENGFVRGRRHEGRCSVVAVGREGLRLRRVQAHLPFDVADDRPYLVVDGEEAVLPRDLVVLGDGIAVVVTFHWRPRW